MALCSRCPSIHFFVSRSRSVADCAHIQAFTFLLTKTLSRSRSVAWQVHIQAFTKLTRSWSVVRGAVLCGVWCVVWVHEGVVLCDELCVVLCDELYVVLRDVLRGVWVFYFSFFLFFLFLALSLSFFLVLSFFCLVFLFSLLPLSLLANKHCVKHWSTNVTSNFEAFACDLAHGRCSAVGSLLSPPSLPLPFQRTKKSRELFITGIFPARELFFITFLNKFQKLAAGENYSHYSLKLIRKQ